MQPGRCWTRREQVEQVSADLDFDIGSVDERLSSASMSAMDKTPSTVPAGLRLELSRHRVIPGQSEVVDEWMQMLNDRAEECRVTLSPERMAVEAVFRLRDEQGEWLYWFELAGDGGSGLTEEQAVDRDHIAFAKRAKVPGHEVAEPLLLLLPEPVERVVRSWAATGAVTDAS
jgi:hypothetical protein